MRKPFVAIALAWMLAAASAPACSLCGNVSRNSSLAFEFDQARVIVYGHLANSKQTDQLGNGTTEFHFDKIVKPDAAFEFKKMVTIARYLPIVDPKTPPKYVMFFRAGKQGHEIYYGKEVANPAVIEFVAELQRLRTDPAQRLIRAAKHLDHADPLIADEAFMIFAKADDKLIAQHAGKLDPAPLRRLVKNADLEPERLSMFAYLLGACGNGDDAELLRSLLKNPGSREFRSYEGILAGYMTIRPKEGWALAQETLKTEKQSFLARFAAMRTMRFFYNANPKEHGPKVLDALVLAIGQAEIADIAIEDLRKWQRWEHTKLVLSCWDKKSHRSAITQQSLVRYAIACPLPEARTFLDRVRRQDPELVREMEAAAKE